MSLRYRNRRAGWPRGAARAEHRDALWGLTEAIERAASSDLRSANAEIEVLLREALARRGVKLAKAKGGG